jgi:hypothetical protein
MTDWLKSLVNNRKITFSAIAAAVFIAVSLPQTYHQTDRLPYVQTVAAVGDCPTPVGQFVHAGIFFVILYFIMKWLNKSGMSDGLVAKYSFYAALLFLVLNSTDMINMTTQAPYMGDIVDDVGCLNKKGVVIHGLIYLVLLTLMMHFPKDQ